MSLLWGEPLSVFGEDPTTHSMHLKRTTVRLRLAHTFPPELSLIAFAETTFSATLELKDNSWYMKDSEFKLKEILHV
jgi:hypothetical protein